MGLSARRIKSSNGERFVVLVDGAGMPLFYPALYVSDCRLPRLPRRSASNAIYAGQWLRRSKPIAPKSRPGPT